MATTVAFTPLPIAAPDDTMEMSSPGNRNIDDDIEIDFDEDHGGVHITDDEQMLEDGDPTRPTAAPDDLMEDDVLDGDQVIEEEEVMQDGASMNDLQDEELIDYTEDELQDEAIEDAVIETVPNESLSSETKHVEQSLAGDQDLREENSFHDVAENLDHGITEVEAEEISPHLDENNSADAIDSATGDTAGDAEEEADYATHPHDNEEHLLSVVKHHAEVDEQAKDSRSSVSADGHLDAETDTQVTATDTGLHPVNIRYDDVQTPLFKSKNQLDGLLKDDNLASLSLAELMQDCRQRLAVKRGKPIPEEQELVLSFDSLGLMLIEDSRAAFESSLNDIIDVYLLLLRNDGILEAPPLSLRLSLQLKFAGSLSIFKQAAAGGQGMSNFGFPNGVSHDRVTNEQKEDVDATNLNGDQYGEDDEGDEEAQHEDDTTYFDFVDEQEDTGQRDFAENAQHEQTSAGDSGEHVYHEQVDFEPHSFESASNLQQVDHIDERAEALKGPISGSEEVKDLLSALDESGPSAYNEEQIASQHAHPVARRAASDASSMTAQGDIIPHPDGERDKLIEWDDDGLTGETAVDKADGPDDLVTLSKDYDDNDLVFSDQALQPPHPVTDLINESPNGDELEENADHKGVDAPQLGSEDIVDVAAEHEQEAETLPGEDEVGTNGHEPDEGVEGHGQKYDQADNAEQQDEHYLEDETDEEEQFDNAYDLGVEAPYEHGLEHDVAGAEHNFPQDDEENVDATANRLDEDTQYNEDDLDFEDELNFEDDAIPFQNRDDDNTVQESSKSLREKRSFNNTFDTEEQDRDEPELKKARPR